VKKEQKENDIQLAQVLQKKS